MMRRSLRKRAEGRPAPAPGWWLAACATAAVVVVAAAALSFLSRGGLVLGPLLAIPPALAGIGAPSPRRPLAYGAVMLAGAIALIPFTRESLLGIATPVSVTVVAAVSMAGVELTRAGTQIAVGVTPVAQKLADVTSVAEVVQRALLRPLPQRVGPLEFEVVYLAAAAEARVGGDLYEVARTQFGIRLIVGDARGKGLDAVEIAADVLGVFREVAHEVYTLAEVARRIDASLARRMDASRAHHGRSAEDFVTAVLAEIDPSTGSLTVYNCGHPPPILLSPGRPDSRKGNVVTATLVDVPSPAPPLRLLSLGDRSGAERTLSLGPRDALLFYTDGVTEARNPRGRCYALTDRIAKLAGVSVGGIGPDLLQRLRDDLLRHVGSHLGDDAALVLAKAPATWGDAAPEPAQAAAP